MSDQNSTLMTFLFTDIEDSGRLWEESPVAMKEALEAHDQQVNAVIRARGGQTFKSWGDAFCATFRSASDACVAALEILRHADALVVPRAGDSPAAGSLRVRAAIHTGHSVERNGDYFGPTLTRVARLLGAAAGGQVLLSGTSAELTREKLPPSVSLTDLGTFQLRGIGEPQRIFQLCHPDLRTDFPALRLPGKTPFNLPTPLSSFVGRENEMAEVELLLKTTRLLSITGPGGSGKSRLAVRLGLDLVEEHPDGVFLVELGVIESTELIWTAILHSLRLRGDSGRSTLEIVSEFLASRRLLLILDNCEHLIRECGEISRVLLQRSLHLKILTTTRERLGVAGETTWAIPPLSLPTDGSSPGGDAGRASLLQSEAVRLFVERAGAALPSFRLGDHNGEEIARICRRLDGIPLAVELAAARIRVLSPGQILERLNNCFALLAGGDRGALPRQQTMRAAIDWSYDLLSPLEQRLFQATSVFHGGWTLEALEAIGPDAQETGADTLDLLSKLVDKSLVEAQVSNIRGSRYHSLEVLHRYAIERLHEAGRTRETRHRHALHYLELAETASLALERPDQSAWLDTLELEHPNLRAAMEFGLECMPELALQIAGSLWRFWYVRGHLHEGGDWLARALEIAETEMSLSRARALAGAGNLADARGAHREAQRYHQKCLQIRRCLGDRRGIASALNNLGTASSHLCEYETALACKDEAREIYEALGDNAGVSRMLNNLGALAKDTGNYEKACQFYMQSLEVHQSTGDQWGLAAVLNNLGQTLTILGDYPAARLHLQKALAMRWELGDMRSLARSLINLARLYRDEGDLPKSAWCVGAAESARCRGGFEPRAPNDREHMDLVEMLSREMGSERYHEAWSSGYGATPESVVESTTKETDCSPRMQAPEVRRQTVPAG